MAQQATSGEGRRMSWQTKTYCVGMLVLGGATLGAWSIHWQGWWTPWRDVHTAALVGLVGALAIACQLIPIRLSASYKLVLNDAIYFAALLLLGAPIAIAAAGAAAVIAHLILIAQRKRRLFDTLFNVGRCMVSIGTAGAVLAAFVPLRAPYLLKDGAALVPLALVLAAVTLYVMETFPTCVAVWLLHKKDPVALWVKNCQADFYYVLARFPAALVLAITAREHALTILLLALPIAGTYVALRIAMRRQPAGDGATTFAEALADAVDARSAYTAEHSKRVAAYAERLAKGLGLPGPQVALVRQAARVHDVGMVGVPDEVLLKPDRLTGDERALVDQRTQIAYELLAPFPEYLHGRELVRLQRVPFSDGGSSAPADLLAAQAIGAADALDAMVSRRPYRPALSPAQALEEFRRHAGSRWHPHVVAEVERLLGAQGEVRIVSQVPLHAAA